MDRQLIKAVGCEVALGIAFAAGFYGAAIVATEVDRRRQRAEVERTAQLLAGASTSPATLGDIARAAADSGDFGPAVGESTGSVIPCRNKACGSPACEAARAEAAERAAQAN